MKNLSYVSPLPLQHRLDKSEKDIKELKFEILNALRDILWNPISMYYDLIRDSQFNNYTTSIKTSALRRYK